MTRESRVNGYTSTWLRMDIGTFRGPLFRAPLTISLYILILPKTRRCPKTERTTACSVRRPLRPAIECSMMIIIIITTTIIIMIAIMIILLLIIIIIRMITIIILVISIIDRCVYMYIHVCAHYYNIL